MTNEDNLLENRRNAVMNALKRKSVEKYVATTGDLARIDATIANTYIVYMKDGKMVKDYPNGEIVEINGEID
ncbi:hypothetical protein [Bacillus toyonensis]|uniref:hypothetical protein n=1 Tax=Bacillus toyonensis TaxID=155322 RepID=UPI002E201BE9|nr:hypothetical protein [Bacillus toyonensis]